MAPVGQEVVYRVWSTPKGAKVTEYDGRGLREGLRGSLMDRADGYHDCPRCGLSWSSAEVRDLHLEEDHVSE